MLNIQPNKQFTFYSTFIFYLYSIAQQPSEAPYHTFEATRSV